MNALYAHECTMLFMYMRQEVASQWVLYGSCVNFHSDQNSVQIYIKLNGIAGERSPVTAAVRPLRGHAES